MNTRRISFDILKRIEIEDVYVGEVLDSALRTMQFSDKRDRAFITRLVEGVTERRISLDFLIEKYSKKTKKSETSKSRSNRDIDINIVLQMGIYQINYMEGIPDRAAISESVTLVKELGYEGLSGYVNGLLRNISKLKEDKKLDSVLVSRMDVRYSTPKWLCDSLTALYGKETAKAILEDQYKDHDTVIRVNLLKTDREDLKQQFEQKGINVKDGLLSDRCLRINGYDSVRRLPGYNKGLFVVQDETSVYTIEHIGIKPGDKILDICAAPGGKSLLAYDQKEEQKPAIVVSRDISKSKLEKIKENSERLGVPVRLKCKDEERVQPGINLEIGDATKIYSDLVTLSDEEKFDVVIADVPCSGLGIIGRKNDIKYHMTPEILEELADQGLVILTNASYYVKRGGRICFSTCTINPQENGEVVRRFLEDNKENENNGFEIMDEKTFLQGIDGSDGFYYCILRKM